MPRERVLGPKKKKQLSPIEKQHLDRLTNFGCGSAAYIRTFTRREIRKLYPRVELPPRTKGVKDEVFYAPCQAEDTWPIAFCQTVEDACGCAINSNREVVCAH